MENCHPPLYFLWFFLMLFILVFFIIPLMILVIGIIIVAAVHRPPLYVKSLVFAPLIQTFKASEMNE